MMKYYKLFDLLNRREMKKTELLAVVSGPTLAKLGKGDSVTTDVLCKICGFLNCQPGDIMEYVPENIAQAPAASHTLPPISAPNPQPASSKPKSKAVKHYKLLTEEAVKEIDLDKLLSDVLYQLSIADDYGMGALESLLKKARQREVDRT